jgi:methionyl-tRNA synthetase
VTRRHLVTAALPYSNGRLHVGHIAGAYLPADTYVRFLRARGEQVRFVCGSDDNGVAALLSARKEGMTPEELTARYHARQKADFEGLGIRFDIYGGTHQPGFAELHARMSQDFFRSIHDQGYFVKRRERQLFDAAANQFLPDRYVKGRCYHVREDGTPCAYPEAYGDQCESCGSPIEPAKLIDPVSVVTGARPELRETTHWYLQLGKLEEKLREWLQGKRGEWREHVLNYSLGQIRQGLPERAMTRDLAWGVPVPLDDPDARGKVLYVWFDAPIGYVSFTAKLCEGEGDRFERWWKDPDCRVVHFIGEDNIVFHALTWPAMLMAEGSYRLPSNVVANAFLNIRFPGKEEEKISKSRGTAVWIEEYLRRFEPDPLRYYLTAIAPETRRTAFGIDDLIARNNSELVNALGNFVNRALTFAQRYFDSKAPVGGPPDEADRAQLAALPAAADRVAARLERFEFRAGLAEVMELARTSNKYFEDRQPWKQRKEDPDRCAATIRVCLRTVRTLATLMAPFLPHSAAQCARMLGIDPSLPWAGAADEIAPGAPLGEPRILFRKIDPETAFG